MSGAATTLANPSSSGGQVAVVPAPPANRPRRDYVGIGLWISLAVSALIWALPFVFMFLTSVKTNADVNTAPTWHLPSAWQWVNYADAVDTGDLWVTGANSLVVAIIKVPIGLLLAAAAAYALARLRFRFSKLVLAVLVAGSMVPIQVGLGPLFTTMLRLDLLDTKLGLILPYLAFGVPYQIFMLYGFFRAIPDELEESARLDGASTFRIFWQICLPLAKPALAALFILDFVATWNEYAIAATLLQSQDNWTVPLAVLSFSGQRATEYGPLNAFIIMSAVPVLIVYLLFQRYFVAGAFSGAVKG